MEEEQEEGGDKDKDKERVEKANSTKDRRPLSVKATTHPAKAVEGGGKEEVDKVESEVVEQGVQAQRNPAILPLQEEEQGPALQTPATRHRRTQLGKDIPHLPRLPQDIPHLLLPQDIPHLPRLPQDIPHLLLPQVDTPLPPDLLALDILLLLVTTKGALVIPMELQEIIKIMTTTTRQTQTMELHHQINMELLAGQPAMGIQLQKSTLILEPATLTTPSGAILVVALSMREGGARV